MIESLRSRIAPFVIILIGFTSIVVQVVLIRELGVVFYGNELSTGAILCVWLLWTAVGSGLFTRFFHPGRPERLIGLFQGLLAVILPFSLHLVRHSKILLNVTLGEMIGFIPMLTISLLSLAPFCICSGLLYGLACGWLTPLTGDPNRSIGRVYFLEAVGAGVGGWIASFLFIPILGPTEILIILSVFNLFSALLISGIQLPASTTGRISVALITGFVIALLFIGAPRFQANLDRLLWRGYHLIGTEHSIHGNIAVTRMGEQYSFYQNGLLMFTVPDRLSSESAVHFTLLEHPHPRHILLIGGGLGGSLDEVLKHPTVETIDYVELDPTLVQTAKKILPQETTGALSHPKVTIHTVDGRRFVQSADRQFDTILLNLPNPYTAQLNRFYTVEFFREVHHSLDRPGVFSFQVASSENAIGPELALFLRSMDAGIRTAFSEVVHLPGETLRFIVSNTPGILTSDPDTLISRLHARQLETQYVREYYLPYELSPDRSAAFEERMHSAGTPVLNTDFRPIGYLYDTMLWATTYSRAFKGLFALFTRLKTFHLVVATGGLVVLCITIVWMARGRKGLFQSGVHASIFAIGFTEISLEVILILGFQVIFGYVYSRLAVIISGYMVGLSLGTMCMLRKSRSGRPFRMLKIAQTAMLTYPLFVLGLLHLFHRWSLHGGSDTWIGWIFPALTAGAGFIGGYQFPLANRLIRDEEESVIASAGKLYGLDLLGSSLGALFTSAILIPTQGVRATLFFLSFLNACILLMLIIASRPEPQSV